MKLPTRKQCIQYYKDLETPQNIIRHVKTVNKIAVFLARQLNDKGINIDVELVDKASLLHDLDKWLCINDGDLRHGHVTEKILQDKGFPKLGFYAKQHTADLIGDKLNSWEEKVITYADRRVLNDSIVSLKKRLDYFIANYPQKYGKGNIFEPNTELEAEIFDELDFSPDELAKMLKL